MNPLVIDGAVVLVYFGLIVGIGLSQRKRSRSVEGYTLGDRQIAWWAVLASILAAEISAATFLGAPESGFTHRNWAYAQFAIVIVLAWQLWRGPVEPSHQFLIFAVALTVITLLTALYTMVGGIRAVIWTDFIRVTVLVAALGFTIHYLLGEIPGGWDSVKAVIEEPVFFDFAKPAEPGVGAWLRNVLTEEYTIWTAVIGITILTMATHGIDQDTVQRMLTAKNRKQSAAATMLSGVIDLPIVSSFILIGILLLAFYQHHPKTQIIPLVLGILGFTFGSLLGIFLVAIFFPRRGTDRGNVIAMSLGFVAVVFFSSKSLQFTAGIDDPLVLAFPWRIACGALVTILVAICFPGGRRSS